MHRHLPPIAIDGFDHPYALHGIAVRLRPDWADACCATCQGRGARNGILHLDSQRCVIEACDDCSGVGWITDDGVRHVPAITLVGGHPAWTTAIIDPRVARLRPAAGPVPSPPEPVEAHQAVEREDLLEAA